MSERAVGRLGPAQRGQQKVLWFTFTGARPPVPDDLARMALVARIDGREAWRMSPPSQSGHRELGFSFVAHEDFDWELRLDERTLASGSVEVAP